MLTGENLQSAVSELPRSAFQTTAFRLVHIRYSQEPLSSIGSLRVGGRYNIHNQFPALYTSDTPITALRELESLVETAAGLMAVKSPPYLLLSIECHLNAVVDLTELTHQQNLGTNFQESTGLWKPMQTQGQDVPTQLLGSTAYNSNKIEALKVSSARDSGAYNLVIFPDRLSSSSSLEIYDPSGTVQARLP